MYKHKYVPISFGKSKYKNAGKEKGAFGGGMAGSYLGARRLGNTWLRYVLAVVLLVAAIKLILI